MIKTINLLRAETGVDYKKLLTSDPFLNAELVIGTGIN